jgi:pentatricopeptide repeat protein
MAVPEDVSMLFSFFDIFQSEVCMFGAAALVYLFVSSGLPARLKPKVPKSVDASSDRGGTNQESRLRAAAGAQKVTDLKRAVVDAAAQEALHLEKNAKLIRDFGKEGKLQDAIDAFASIKLGCSTMTTLPYNSILDACVQCSDMQKAAKYFADAKELELVDVVSYNTMIKGLLTSGGMEPVKGLLAEMAQQGMKPTHVTFHSILHAAVRGGDRDAAWSWLSELQRAELKPTSVTCSILLKLVTKPSHGADMSRVMSLIKEGEMKMDEVLLTSIVDVCLKTQRLDLLAERLRDCKDKSVFNRLSAPTYGAMIKAYGQAQNVGEVWNLWNGMIRSDVQPTVITLGCMVDALVMNGGVDSAWELVNELWEQESQKVLLNTVIYSTILKGFAMNRLLGKAFAVYDTMQARGVVGNTITYNTMLNALVRCGDIRRLPQLLEDMRSASPQVEPDMITYSTIMKGYCSSGDLDKGLELLRDMVASGQYAPDEVMYNSLLEGCAKEQRLEDALTLLNKMQAAGVAQSNYTLSIMIKLLGRAKHLSKAFDMLQEAKRKGVRPNIQVWTCLMQACFHNRQLKKALAVHDECVDDGCLLDEKAYTSLARGCMQAGAVETAVEVVRCASGLSGHGLRQAKVAPQGVDAKCLQEILKKLEMGGKKQLAQQLSEDLEAGQRQSQVSRSQQRGNAPWRR